MNPLSPNLTFSAVQSASLGIGRGLAGLGADAQAVASTAGSGADPTAALVDSQQQKLAVEADVKVLSASDQTLGSLLDILA